VAPPRHVPDPTLPQTKPRKDRRMTEDSNLSERMALFFSLPSYELVTGEQVER
jgi:hypothetical protein